MSSDEYVKFDLGTNWLYLEENHNDIGFSVGHEVLESITALMAMGYELYSTDNGEVLFAMDDGRLITVWTVICGNDHSVHSQGTCIHEDDHKDYS